MLWLILKLFPENSTRNADFLSDRNLKSCTVKFPLLGYHLKSTHLQVYPRPAWPADRESLEQLQENMRNALTPDCAFPFWGACVLCWLSSQQQDWWQWVGWVEVNILTWKWFWLWQRKWKNKCKNNFLPEFLFVRFSPPQSNNLS